MRLSAEPPLHLTYCLNVHPGESWDAQFGAIREYARAVRDRVASGRPFGLGLRLSAESARELNDPGNLARFRAFLAAENLYVFTINGFPYGAFHGTRVKENVYRPDWRSADRLAYTSALADILAELLPADVAGSISTVPVGFASDFTEPDVRALAADQLVAMARHLAHIEKKTGRYIHLGLEPEPACVLETGDQTIEFFEFLHNRAGSESGLVRRYLGICFDTCHVALAFENLADTWDRYRQAGILVSKVQISAALETRGPPPATLADFVEPVYLHQVRMRRCDGSKAAWLDLPDALAVWPGDAACARIHFHVPLFWSGGNGLYSTATALDEAFWSRLRGGACPHLEIETYTFDVLPPELRVAGVVDSISREFAWVRSRFG